MKFLVPNYKLQLPPDSRLGGYRPQIPVLCPQLNLLNTPPQNKISWYATGSERAYLLSVCCRQHCCICPSFPAIFPTKYFAAALQCLIQTRNITS